MIDKTPIPLAWLGGKKHPTQFGDNKNTPRTKEKNSGDLHTAESSAEQGSVEVPKLPE